MDQATFKAQFFKALSSPLRIRILGELRQGELSVNELCRRLDAEQSTVSQQLAVLRNQRIILGRKDGSTVYYSVVDSAIFALLDAAKKVFNNHLVDVSETLAQIAVEK